MWGSGCGWKLSGAHARIPSHHISPLIPIFGYSPRIQPPSTHPIPSQPTRPHHLTSPFFFSCPPSTLFTRDHLVLALSLLSMSFRSSLTTLAPLRQSLVAPIHPLRQHGWSKAGRSWRTYSTSPPRSAFRKWSTRFCESNPPPFIGLLCLYSTHSPPLGLPRRLPHRVGLPP